MRESRELRWKGGFAVGRNGIGDRLLAAGLQVVALTTSLYMAEVAATRVRKGWDRMQAKKLPRPNQEELEQLQQVKEGGDLPDYFPSQRMYLALIVGFRPEWLPGGPRELTELAVGGRDGLIAAVTDAKARLRVARREAVKEAVKEAHGHLVALKAEFERRGRLDSNLDVLDRAHINAARSDVLYNISDESPSHWDDWGADDVDPDPPLGDPGPAAAVVDADPRAGSSL